MAGNFFDRSSFSRAAIGHNCHNTRRVGTTNWNAGLAYFGVTQGTSNWTFGRYLLPVPSRNGDREIEALTSEVENAQGTSLGHWKIDSLELSQHLFQI